MIFDAKNISDPYSPEMMRFRHAWVMFIGEENEYLSKKLQVRTNTASPMQRFLVDMYTGVQPAQEDEANQFKAEDVIVGVLPAQMELEAVFRARSRALAAAMSGRLPNAEG